MLPIAKVTNAKPTPATMPATVLSVKAGITADKSVSIPATPSPARITPMPSISSRRLGIRTRDGLFIGMALDARVSDGAVAKGAAIAVGPQHTAPGARPRFGPDSQTTVG